MRWFLVLLLVFPCAIENVGNSRKYLSQEDIGNSYFKILPKSWYPIFVEFLQELDIRTLNADGLHQIQEHFGLDNLDTLIIKQIVMRLPDNAFINDTETTTLVLTGNQIEEICDGAFRHLNKLISLYLDDNRLTELLPSTFEDLHNLKSLYLLNNRLKEIRSDWFLEDFRLEELFLLNNQITILKNGTFKNLPKLTLLHLRNNKIKTIESNAFQGLASLKYLIMANNQIELLWPDTFIDLLELNSLYLENNKIKSLPVQLFKTNQKIVNIYLQSNHLTVVSAEPFYHLTNLEVLSVAENQLVEFEGENIPASVIRVARNKLKYLKFHTKVTHINAQENEIFSIILPSSLTAAMTAGTAATAAATPTIINLRGLNLSRNNVTDIGNISSIDTLLYLDLAHNEIINLPANIFTGKLERLIKLNLANNKLTDEDFGLLSLPNLNFLNVVGNNLTRLPDNLLELFPRLKRISVDNGLRESLREKYGNEIIERRRWR